jgi:hypothetical protein
MKTTGSPARKAPWPGGRYIWGKEIKDSKGKGKGKAIPLQPWIGPDGSRRLRLPDFKTVDT